MRIKQLLCNKSAKNFLIYFGFEGINRALPFIILPIIAAYISTTEYGILTNFTILVQILSAVVALNTYSALSVFYFKDNNRIVSIFSNLAGLILILSVICFFVLLLFSRLIEFYFRISFFWQVLALITASTASIISLYTTLLRMQKKAISFAYLQLSQSFFMFVLAIMFVVVFLWNWQGRALSMVISNVLVMFFCLLFMFRKNPLLSQHTVNLFEIKKYFLFGLPLLPHTLSFWFKSGMDKIIITNTVSLSANGIYSISLTLGGIIGLFTNAFFNMYSPHVYEKLHYIETASPDEASKIKRKLVSQAYYFCICLLLICVFSYFIMAIIIRHLFSGDYLLSIPLLPFVLVISFFNAMYAIVSIYLFYMNKTKQLGITTFSASVLQVLLTYFGVSIWGTIGALYSGVFVSFIIFVSVFYLSNKYYPLPWFAKHHNIKTM